jgi:IclR family transcriptional regulator, acetate operon repressor
MTVAEGTGGTRAVDRAAELLRLVVEADRAQSFTELLEGTQLPKSTLSRLLAAVERHRLLERTAEGLFVAGPLFALYAARHDPWAEVARLAKPVMHELGEATRETVNLGIARGRTVVQIAQIDSQYLLGARDWLDAAVPPHCSALGKVLFAFEALDLGDELEPATEKSLTTMAQLRREADRTRKRGYACAVDELEVGLTAVAAPVHGPDGDVVAALGVSGSTSRLVDEVEPVGRLLVEQAQALSNVLRRRPRSQEGAA